MKALACVRKASRALALAIETAAGAVLLFLVGILAWSGVLGGLSAAGARWVGDPPLWVTEVAEFGLLPIGLLGAALALRARAHQGIDALARLLPARLQRANDALVWAIIATFGGVFAWLGAAYVLANWEVGGRLDSVDLPKWIFYLCYPLAGALFLVFSIEGFLEAVLGEPARPPDLESAAGGEGDAR